MLGFGGVSVREGAGAAEFFWRRTGACAWVVLLLVCGLGGGRWKRGVYCVRSVGWGLRGGGKGLPRLPSQCGEELDGGKKGTDAHRSLQTLFSHSFLLLPQRCRQNNDKLRANESVSF